MGYGKYLVHLRKWIFLNFPILFKKVKMFSKYFKFDYNFGRKIRKFQKRDFKSDYTFGRRVKETRKKVTLNSITISEKKF